MLGDCYLAVWMELVGYGDRGDIDEHGVDVRGD